MSLLKHSHINGFISIALTEIVYIFEACCRLDKAQSRQVWTCTGTQDILEASASKQIPRKIGTIKNTLL